ncbi:MAG: hypothetical protein LBQ56_02020 [Synergistaceae bacterium]|jgi:hypothetical protein|nr:hypothetical protein [Synergistaceae bacterium]
MKKYKRMFLALLNMKIGFLSTLSVIMAICLAFFMLDQALWEYYDMKDFAGGDINGLMRDFVQQKNYFNARIEDGELPVLGVFQQGSKETEAIWAWAERPFTASYYPGNATIVSLDFQTGKLYVGFTDVYFLREDIPKIYKKSQRWRSVLQGWIIGNNENNNGFSDSGIVVQNARGEEYREGNTLMTLVAVLSSDDLSFYRKKHFTE